MDQDQNFSSLRKLLALKKLDTPKDTEVERFLIEFHRRQRAGVSVPDSAWDRFTAWVGDLVGGRDLSSTLSYVSAFAAIAIVGFLGLSQQVQVTQQAGHPYQLTFRMPAHDTSFAMIPGSILTASSTSQKQNDSLDITPVRADGTATRFVLANNSPGTHDATVAF
jgi:hypothetical protein